MDDRTDRTDRATAAFLAHRNLLSTVAYEMLGSAADAEDVLVFVLREVFDLPYDEIAAAVGKSQAAVRQIAHRAQAAGSSRQRCRPSPEPTWWPTC